MRVFFESRSELEDFLSGLHLLSCSFCGATGTLVRHGYIRGWVSPEKRGIRAWRICCKKARGGCGKAPSVRLAGSLLRRCFTAAQLWAFVQELLQARSVKAAWERCGIRLPLDTAYTVYKRLGLCQSTLRTNLSSRAPPPRRECAGSTLLEVFTHLREAFGDACAISAYQQALQRDFLAIA